MYRLLHAVARAAALSFLFSSPGALATYREPAATDPRVEAAIRPLLGGSKFATSGCAYSLVAVTRFLMLGTPFTQTFKFGPGCDVEGVVEVSARQFPVDFKVRHLGRITRISGQASADVGAAPDLPLAVVVKLDEGKLSASGTKLPVEFTADYRVGFKSVTALGQPASQGGTIRVTEFEGRPVRYSGKLRFD